jgi:predicted nucleotidyltransferase
MSGPRQWFNAHVESTLAQIDLGALAPLARDALAELLAREDPAVVGIVLTGSAGRGMATIRSDVDVFVVREESGADRTVGRSSTIDEIPVTLAELETTAPYGSPGWGYRWSFAWAPVLRDETGGRLETAVRRQATVSDEEARAILLGDAARLDGFINLAYRALKHHRDGRPWAARLDCAEVMPWLLDVVFTLEGRVRPYNKFLAWELRTHPLAGADWQREPLLGLLTVMLDGSETALRELFGAVERACRARDERDGGSALGEVIDSWEPEALRLLRGV